MKAREIVERVRARDIAADEDKLYFALQRIEKRIADYGEFEEKEFDRSGELYAPEGFCDMYEEYLRRENALLSEDWDCFGEHDKIFKEAWKRYCEYIVRNSPNKEQEIINVGVI